MRTNKLFTVTVCKYATMAVEADDVQQAMIIAKKYKDTHLTDRDFADSDIDVYSCEAYGCSLDDMCLKPTDKVYARDEVTTVENYRRELNGEEPLPEPTAVPAKPIQEKPGPKVVRHGQIDRQYRQQLDGVGNPDCPLYAKDVRITGTFDQIQMSRDEVAAACQRMGAKSASEGICKSMDIVIIGNNPGPTKQAKIEAWRAEGHDIATISQFDFKEILNKYSNL